MFSKIKNSILTGSVLLALPLISSAQFDGNTEMTEFGANIVNFINSALIPFVFAVALLLFIYGVFLFFFYKGGEGDSRKAGRQYILWSIAALVVIVSVWGIVNLIAGGLGLDKEGLDSDFIPKAADVRTN